MANYWKRAAALAVLGGALAAGPAQATRVTVDFTAQVYALVQGNIAGGVVDTPEQSTIPEVDVARYDTIVGQYSYDLSLATLSAYQDPPTSGSQTFYDLPGLYVSYTVVRSGYSYESNPTLVYSVAVSNNSSEYGGADALEFSTGNFGNGNPNDISTVGNIVLVDPTATALSDSSLPLNVNEAAFSSHSMLGIWFGYGQLLGISANMVADTSSRPAPVPEPESWAMLLGGLGLVGAVARRRRSLGA